MLIKSVRFDLLKDQMFYESLLPIMIESILETFISAKIGKRITQVDFDKRKEMENLALSNIFSGLLGGLPVAAPLLRTTVLFIIVYTCIKI